MTKPRCVVDTNVLISAGLSPHGTSRRVVRWVIEHGFLLASASTLAEFESRFVERDKFDRYLPRSERASFVAEIRETVTPVAVTSRLSVCADPDDDRFVELAVDGRADCLVTGNARDFPPAHAGVPVLTPAQFARAYVQP